MARKLVMENRQKNLITNQCMEPRKYQFNNSTLTIVFGDITTSKTEVIVSSDNTCISMADGISGCICRAGGEAIRIDAQKKLPAQLGDVVVSTAGTLKDQKFIFHCLTIDYEYRKTSYEKRLSDTEDITKYILQHSVDKCFKLLQVLELDSIAFPCIGAGGARIPLKKVAEVMAQAIATNLCRTQKPYEIELYLYDYYNILTEKDFIDLFESFAIQSALSRYQIRLQEEMQLEEFTPTISSNIYIPQRDEMKHLVFISYARKDKENVCCIKDILKEYEIPYWIDEEGIFSGENYKEVIVDAIEVAKVVVFVSSVNSNSSINVIREMSYAVQQRKTIVPILLDDTPYAKSIRLDIADIDQIEFGDLKKTKKKFITSLAYMLRK